MQKAVGPIPTAFAGTFLLPMPRSQQVIGADLHPAQRNLLLVPDARVPDAAAQRDHRSGLRLTGGDQGLTGGLPRPPFLGIRLDDPHHLYLFCCAVLVALAVPDVPARSIRPSAIPSRMIRDNPQRAAFLGIQVWRIRLLAFVVAGIFGGVGGPAHEPVRVERLPGLRLLDHIGRRGVHDPAGWHERVPRAARRRRALLLLLSDTVTRFTEHFGLVLGIVILFFALGMRKGRPRIRARLPGASGAATFRARVRGRGGKELTYAGSVQTCATLSGAFGATNGVSLHFGAGSLSAIIGPNGAGKTTFFILVTGGVPADAGHRARQRRHRGAARPGNRATAGVGRAFQIASIFPDTEGARDHPGRRATRIAAGTARLGRRFPLAEVQPAGRRSHGARRAVFSRAQHAVAATCPHGDQKLLEIALALALEPRVPLLDEPTAGTGPEERWQTIETGAPTVGAQDDPLSSSSTTWTSASGIRTTAARPELRHGARGGHSG